MSGQVDGQQTCVTDGLHCLALFRFSQADLTIGRTLFTGRAFRNKMLHNVCMRLNKDLHKDLHKDLQQKALFGEIVKNPNTTRFFRGYGYSFDDFPKFNFKTEIACKFLLTFGPEVRDDHLMVSYFFNEA